MSKKEGLYMVSGILILSFLTTRFPIWVVTNFSSGYSLFWFIALYLIGGYLRLYPPKLKKKTWLIIFISCISIVWSLYYHHNNYNGKNELFKWLYYALRNTPDYHTPLVLIASISLLMLFKDIRFKSDTINKVICFVSASVFGIYLFQEANYFKPYFYNNILKVYSFNGLPKSLFITLRLALTIFVYGLIFDLFRRLLFFIISKTYHKSKNLIISATSQKNEDEEKLSQEKN